MGPLTLFSESLDARITYEGRLADAKRECEADVQRARERMAREEIRLRREYEDAMQRAYETHGDAPPSPRDDPSTYFAKQLVAVKQQHAVLNDRIVALEQQTVSPRTKQRLRKKYGQRAISKASQQRLQEQYDADIDERASLVRTSSLATPIGSPKSQESDLEWGGAARRDAALECGLVQMRGYVSADGQMQPLSQCKKVLFQDEVEQIPEEVAPDPQLAAVGGSGGVSSADDA